MKHLRLIFFLYAMGLFHAPIVQALTKPRLTIFLVIDQFSYQQFEKLCPYFNGGLYHLAKYGINYKNTYLPHSMTTTATGHTALNTGVLPKDHGILANSWYDTQGNKVYSDQDTPEFAAVFSPDG